MLNLSLNSFFSQKPWNEAIEFCKANGMEVAQFETEKEMHIVRDNIPEKSDRSMRKKH
jgi:hypothetical protein